MKRFFILIFLVFLFVGTRAQEKPVYGNLHVYGYGKIDNTVYFSKLAGTDTAFLFIRSDSIVDTLSKNQVAGIVLNQIFTDTSYWNQLSVNISNDTTLINSLVSSVTSDTSFLTSISNYLQSDTSFINNLINNISADTSFLTNISNYLQSDTSFISTLITSITGDTTYLNSIVNYLISDTSFYNQFTTLIENDTNIFNIQNTFTFNIDSLLTNDSLLVVYLDSLINANIDTVQIFADKWIKNQLYDNGYSLQHAYAEITGPFLVRGWLSSKYLAVQGIPSAPQGGMFQVIGSEIIKGTSWHEPDNLGYPENSTPGGRRGYFLANTTYTSDDGKVAVLKNINGVMYQRYLRLDSINTYDSLYIAYCNGCSPTFGYVVLGDTVTFDTVFCSNTIIRGDSLFLCSDTLVMTSNGYWSRIGKFLFTSIPDVNLGIRQSNPIQALDVAGKIKADTLDYMPGQRRLVVWDSVNRVFGYNYINNIIDSSYWSTKHYTDSLFAALSLLNDSLKFVTHFHLDSTLAAISIGGAAYPADRIIWVNGRSGIDTTAVRGDLFHPWKTLDSASRYFQSGDLIMVLPSTYYPDTNNSTGGWQLAQKGGTDGGDTAHYLINPVYYFCPNARVIKGYSWNLYDHNLNCDAGAIINPKLYDMKVYGHGTFIRTRQENQSGNGQVIAAGSDLYTCDKTLYVEADTILNYGGDPCIQLRNPDTEIHVKYCKQSGTYAGYFGNNAVNMGAGGKYKLYGYYESVIASTIYQYFNVCGAVVTFEGTAANSASGKAACEIGNAQFYFTGKLTGSSTYGIHIGLISGTASTSGYADITIKEIPASGTKNVVTNNGGNVFLKFSPVYITQDGGKFTFTNTSGNMTIDKFDRAPDATFTTNGGKLNINCDIIWQNTTGDHSFNCAGGTTIINKNMYNLGNPIIIQSGGQCEIHGRINYKRTVNWGGGTFTNAPPFGYTYTRGMINFLGTTQSTLRLMPGARLIDETTTNLSAVIFNECGAKNKIVDYGGMIYSTGAHPCIMLSNYLSYGSTLADTLALELYSYQNTLTNANYYCQPVCSGTTCFNTGYGFNSNPKSFVVSISGGPQYTINLTDSCTLEADIVTHINTVLTAAGIGDTLEAVTKGTQYIYLQMKTSVCKGQNNYIELHSGTALAILGWRQKVYSAKIYKMIQGAGDIVADTDVIE